MKTRWLQAAALVTTVAMVPVATGAMAAVDNSTYKAMDQFLDVYNRVKADYVDKVTDEQLIKGAIDGMLSSLDPHSSYVDASDFEETFHDAGQNDLPACIAAYKEVGFHGPMRPDHVPTMYGETNEHPAYETLGRLFALGYIRGLIHSAYGKPKIS